MSSEQKTQINERVDEFPCTHVTYLLIMEKK